jgi:hypothetical protein
MRRRFESAGPVQESAPIGAATRMRESARRQRVSNLTKRESNELLRGLSFDEASPEAAGGVTVRDEFEQIKDEEKDRLIGMHFRILDLNFKDDGDFGPHATVWIITRNNEKYVFSDGSTGIFRQLVAMRQSHAPLPYDVPKGLRKSEYTWTDHADGKKRPAHTYYLAG